MSDSTAAQCFWYRWQSFRSPSTAPGNGPIASMAEDPTSSILRGVRALVGLAELGRPVSFGVLAEALQLPPSSAHRILSVLRQAGYVAQDPTTGSYSPGTAFLQAATAFCSASTYPRAVHDTLANLVANSGESAFYGAYHAEAQRYRFVAEFYSEHAIQYVSRADKLYSVLWGASGRSVAAYLPGKTLRALYEREKASAEGNHPLPSWEDFSAEMSWIREHGYSTTTNQRFEGAHSTAAPVFGLHERPIGSIGIAMPSVRRDESRLQEFAGLVRDAARQLSAVAQCGIEQSWPELGAGRR